MSAKAFGAVADGSHRPLSERFATLAEAQRVYPFATSLAQTLDWAGIQAALHALGGKQGRVHLPAGRYRISDTIRLPNLVHLYGDGPGVTIIDNQNTILHAPQIVNADPSFVGCAITLLSMHGGTHGLKISVPTGEIAFIMVEGVVFALQSDKNVECDHLLQSSEFRNCGFGEAPFGVMVAGRTTNAVNFYNCNFTAHSRGHLELNGAEAVNFYGGKFEGGGAAPNPTNEERVAIRLDSAAAVNFHGVYFEATQELLLKETHSRNSIAFHGCHFTGADRGAGPIPFRFESDGIVTFGTNDWLAPSDGPARMLLVGDNGQKLGGATTGIQYRSRSPSGTRATSPTTTVRTEVALALVHAVPQPGGRGVHALLSGELVLHGTLGAANLPLSRRYHLCITVTGALESKLETRPLVLCDEAGADAVILYLQPASGGREARLMARLAPRFATAALQWSLDTVTAAGGGLRLDAELLGGA